MDRAQTIARYPGMAAVIAADPNPPDTAKPLRHLAPPEPAPVAGGDLLSPLPGRARRHIAGLLGPADSVRAVLRGQAGQALAVLDERVAIVKPGFQAGAGFGATVTVFSYGQIQGVSLRSAAMSPGLELLTSAYPQLASQSGMGGGRIRKMFYQQPNCLPLRGVDAHARTVASEITARAGR